MTIRDHTRYLEDQLPMQANLFRLLCRGSAFTDRPTDNLQIMKQ